MANQRQVSTLIAIAIGLVLPLYGYGADIYTCVDQKGHKRIQMTPCAPKDRTIGREEFKEPSKQRLAPATEPSPAPPRKPAVPAIDVSPKPVSGTKEMLDELQRAQADAVGVPNGVEVLSSVICRLYEQFSQPDQRQLLLAEAQSLGIGVTNGPRLVAAAMGQCTNASGEVENGASTMPPNMR